MMKQKKSNLLIQIKKLLSASLCLTLITFCHSSAVANTLNQKYKHLAANTDGQPHNLATIRNWFNCYDQIRRQAQLSPAERQRADQIMSKGLSIFMPGADKALAQNLMTELVSRYEIAAQQMSQLQIISATEQLHRAYYQYFIDAKNLFSDYLKLQSDLMAVDQNTGQPIASGLVERKENLSMLDQNNKILDERLRQQYGIQSYQYQPASAN